MSYFYNYRYYTKTTSTSSGRPCRPLVVCAFLTTTTTRLLLILCIFCCCLVPLSTAADAQECNASNRNAESSVGDGGSDDSCVVKEADYYCGLYLAESSIPNSGWGLFAGAKGYRVGDDFPHDVSILVVDTPELESAADYIDNPRFKLQDYVWGPHECCGNYDADGLSRTSQVIPGIGSLANSHSRLFNVGTWEHDVERHPIPRSNASAGAFSQCQRHHFQAMHDIGPGHEVFTRYGDEWFEYRYPDVPRFTDYEAVDTLLSNWKQQLLDQSKNSSDSDGEDYSLSGDLAARIWQELAYTSKQLNDRIQTITPQTHAEAIAAALHPNGLAGATFKYSRSLEWLQQHGMCMDHLQLKPSEHVPYQNGAFVKRPFQKGERLTPVPTVPISRGHLLTNRGQNVQLLLNYCYGHPESSLLLFPNAALVNLINHASPGGNHGTPGAGSSSMHKKANVALRWSPLNNSTHLQQSVREILSESRTTILLELYALRDLEADEEVLLDYGASFEIAWQCHEHEWQLSPPIHSEDYQPPHDFVMRREHFTMQDDDNGGNKKYPPSHIQPRCWIDVHAAKLLGMDEDEWYPFVADGWHPLFEQSEVIMDWTVPCEILSVSSIDPETGLRETYGVVVYDDEFEVHVKDVPWNAITFVDKPYQGHQFLRQAFRHEIHLSDELFPEAWKDLPVVPPKCKLYMAESTIPNSTVMGVYTAQPIAAGDRIHFGDVVVLVVDYQQNNQLLREFHQIKNGETDRSWLLDSYYRHFRQVSLEAKDVRSIIPGLGMLANTQLQAGPVINAEIVEPVQSTTLHRAHDAGAAASSYYHDAHFIATKFLQAGEELVFENVVSGENNVAETAPAETQPRLRTVEWLEANGRCLDYIRPGDSTILQAGKGAFATRRIAQGTVIAPVPVVPILRRDLELFESVENEQGTMEIRYLGKQLLTNYCYGHPSSPLLLFPYSPVVNYVNHNTTPNSKLQWSTLSSNQRDWLNRSPADLAGEASAGIILELVALRDIQPNEEVFIDYGDEWMEKWREFELVWHPPENQENYVPAWLLNKRMEWIRTEEEQETDPYPYDSVFTACFVGHTPTLVDDSIDPPIYHWTYIDGIYKDMYYLLPCDILERDIGDADLTEVMDRHESIAPLEVHYKVRVHHEEEQSASIYLSVPREAIRFFDNKYTSDLFLRNAFRHEIHLPDELVPKAWRVLE